MVLEEAVLQMAFESVLGLVSLSHTGFMLGGTTQVCGSQRVSFWETLQVVTVQVLQWFGSWLWFGHKTSSDYCGYR